MATKTITPEYQKSFDLMISDIFEGYDRTASNGTRTLTLTYNEHEDKPFRAYDNAHSYTFRTEQGLCSWLFDLGYTIK